MSQYRSIPALVVAALSLAWTSCLAAGAGSESKAAEAESESESESESEGEGVPTVIMILSPRMVYALGHWARMRSAAEAAGFVVQAMRDPRIGDEEWRLAADAAESAEARDLPALQDGVIARLGVLNHSPTSVVRLGSRIHPWPIAGVMPDEAWTGVLKQRLAQLRGP